jgi:hypothetical protein
MNKLDLNMAKEYMVESITAISKYYATKDQEKDFIHVITNVQELTEYQNKCCENNLKQPVFMEYYTFDTPIKPYFDLDVKVDGSMTKKELKYNEDIIRCGCFVEIEKHFNRDDFIVLKRPTRKMKDGQWKISYRVIVNNVITNVSTMKNLVSKIQKDNPLLAKYFDINPYREGTNKLCMLGGIKPFDKSKDSEKDKPKPLHFFDEDDSKKYTFFDTAITYIKDDFKKYYDVPIVSNDDSKLSKDEKDFKDFVIKQATNDFEKDDKETIDDRKNDYFIKQFKNHLMALSNERAIEYNDWYKTICIIVNCYEKYSWTRDTLYDLAHCFSEKAGDKYDYNSVEKKVASASTSTRNDKVGYLALMKMLKEDNKEYYDENITKNYYEKKQEFEEEFCVINNPLCFYRTPKIPRVITENSSLGEINQQLTESALVTMKRAEKYLKRKEDEKTGKISYEKAPFIKEWLNDEKRKTYEGLRFEPAGLTELESKFYKNIFTGFQADKIELTDAVDYTRIDPILDHIKNVLCNKNEDHYKYVVNWFSRIIQDPTNRPQTGLVFYSKKHGVGKNIFTNYFANEILGVDLSVSAKNMDSIFGRFNSLLSKCMFLIMEEASGDVKKFMEDLKNCITEPTITIEKKNIDRGTYRNFVNVLFNTNNENCFDFDDKDRRFVMLSVSDEMKDNKKYFDDLNKCMKNKQNTALFIKYLREKVECDWTTADFQANRPITEVYKKQQQLSAKNYMKFISHIMSDDGIIYESGDLKLKCKWKKYNGRLTACVKQYELWGAYSSMCNNYKYTAFPYDTFFNRLTDDTGITLIINHKTKCLKIDKEKTEKWVELFRNTANNGIEVWDDSKVEEVDDFVKSDSEDEEDSKDKKDK